MKTAISVPDELFREIEKIAKEHHYSRSEVFVIAVKEYLENRKSQSLLAALNQAYETAEAPEEYKAREESKKRYAKTVQKERY
ncbi:MAG: CopG family transcriptional regulator [Thermodesulfovibrio sp.]|nr:CopG family transcriptional regulator [Thermodesulfovibrio sp.]